MPRTLTAKLFIPAIMTLLLSTGYQAVGQNTPKPTVRNLRAQTQSPGYDDTQLLQPQLDAQLLSKDLRSQRKQMIAANMNFTDSEAERFWPVYDRYAAELGKIYDTKLSVVGDYLDNYNTMSGEDTERYLQRRVAVEQDVLQ